jgi:tyrosyl-tRNA synthetase
MVETELASSRGRARTTIEQGGAYVNNRREVGVDRSLMVGDLVAGRYVVLRSGKKNYCLVRFA